MDTIFGYEPDYILSLDFRSKEGKEIKKKTLKNSSFLKRKAREHKKKILFRDNIKRENINNNCKKIIKYFKSNITLLVKLQSFIRGCIQREQNYLRGDGFFDKNKSVNEVDFFTIEKIMDIDNKYFFSYKDNDSFIYSFDIRSLSKLFETNNKTNPFTRKKFPENMLLNYKKRISQMNKLKIDSENFQEIILDEKTKFRQKIISVFQKMDNLGHYTDIKWFTKLKRKQLKDWYKFAEDIFNYRANLTNAVKKKIIPNGDAFPYSIDHIYCNNISNKELRSICISEMDKFVSKGLTKEDRYTGSLYMLTALTQVSTAAAESLYWLVQTP